MYKAIIFDFFGVISRSTYQLVIEDTVLSKPQELQLTDLHKSFDNGFVTDEEFLVTYAEILGMDYQTFVNKYYESEGRSTNSPQMLALVDSLKNSYKVGLLSNIGLDGYKKFIQPIEHHFDAVVTSYSTGMAKPNTAIFEHMANKLDVDVSECIMIDDLESNCEGARAAGMQAICFTTITSLKTQLSENI
jgi:epoxide hydrolase-like predicted phosphatase